MNHFVRNAILAAAALTGTEAAQAAPLRDGWYVNDDQTLALIEGTAAQSGAVLGVQCDRNDPRGRRLVFGAVRRLDRDGLLREIGELRPAVLRIAIESQSAYAEFLVEIEDKAQSEIGSTADLAVAYLTREQYALVRSAKSVTIRVGDQAYWFNGKGSASATDALPCARAPQIKASRFIATPAKSPEPVRPVQTPWSFTSRLLAADPAKGRYLASTSTVGFPQSPLASFNFEVVCQGNRLYAAFTNGSVANSVATSAAYDPGAVHSALNTRDNVAEIYRNGREIARFPVETGSNGKGHMLTPQDLSALLVFDRIVVSGQGQTRSVEFTANGGPQAISALAEACGTRSR